MITGNFEFEVYILPSDFFLCFDINNLALLNTLNELGDGKIGLKYGV